MDISSVLYIVGAVLAPIYGFGERPPPNPTPPEDMRCKFSVCNSALGSPWRGIAATERDLWDRVTVRLCNDCIKIVEEGERKRGWILRGSPEGYLYFDIPWIQMQWGLKAR